MDSPLPSSRGRNRARDAFRVVALCLLCACRSERNASIGAGGDAEPVALADDELSTKEIRVRDALRGLSYDGDRLEVVASEAAGLVAGPDAELARRELERGRALLERNLRLEAIAAFTRAVLAAPDDGAPYEALGDALLARRWSRRAELAFRAGVDVAPESPTLRLKLADALLREARLDESIAELRRAVELDPGFGAAHARLAVELYYAGDLAGARDAARTAEAHGGRVPPQLEPLLERAEGARENGDTRQGGR